MKRFLSNVELEQCDKEPSDSCTNIFHHWQWRILPIQRQYSALTAGSGGAAGGYGPRKGAPSHMPSRTAQRLALCTHASQGNLRVVRMGVCVPGAGVPWTGLEQNALELQYIAICNSNPVLEWPQRLHSGLECSVMIAINHDCIVPESENRIQLVPVSLRFSPDSHCNFEG